MYYLKQFDLLLLLLFLISTTDATYFYNNACWNIFSYHFSSISSKCYENPDVLSNIESIAQRHGYNTITFSLGTNDAYILKLYRLYLTTRTLEDTTHAPVFVLHGLMISVESWVDIGNRSLAFNLVNRGYDVWLGTFRGTANANKHKNLTVNDPDYWNFNLDTLTNEDTTIQLEFIASLTQQKVVIVAHSMGTTLSFMYAAKYPERANQLLQGIIAMAPVAYLDDVSIIQSVIPWGMPLLQLLKAVKMKGLFYQDKFFHSVIIRACNILPELCYRFASTSSGTTNQFAPEDLPLFASYWLSGLSIYILEHYLQIARSRKFQKFDYHTFKNNKIYGTAQPPVYNLTNIKVPVCLFYGKRDVLYKKQNIERLFDELGSSQKYKIAVPRNVSDIYHFSHIDFIWSKNLHTYLYKDLFDILRLFVGNN